MNYLQQKKQALISTHQGSIPSGYKQVEYLESTGIQWIETNQIVLLTTMVVIHRWERIKNVNFYQVYIGGGINDNSADDFRFMEWADRGSIDFTNGKGFHIGSLVLPQTSANTIKIQGNTINVDGVTKNILIQGCADGIIPVWLFASATPGYRRASACRMGQIEFINDEIITGNLIPCLDNNNRPCMYDTVSKQTFYNQGTGEFLYGEVIN